MKKLLLALVVLVCASVGFFVTPASGADDTWTHYYCTFEPHDVGTTTCDVWTTPSLHYEVVCGHVPYSNPDSPFMLLRVAVYTYSDATVVYAGNATAGDPGYGDVYTAVKPNAHVVSIDGPYAGTSYDWLFGWTVIGGPC